MLARNETIFKWALYAGATAVFFLLQGAVLQRITLWGVIPFVFPILVAVLGMYEGPLPASVYALTVGQLGVRLANALSWFAALVAAFITNKYWVFHRGKEGPAQFFREFFEFTAARLAGLLVQVWGTDALVRKGFQRPILGIQGGAAKLLTTVIVIALNYFFSKFLVFRPREVQS